MKVYIEVDINDSSEYCDDEDVFTRKVTINEIMDQCTDSVFEQHGFIKISENPKDLSYQAKRVLNENGWIHKDTVKNAADKKLFEEQFFIVDMKDSWGTIKDLDVNNVSSYEIQDLASYKKHIVQKVSNKSVLSDSQYKKLLSEKKKIDKRREAARKSAETRAEKKKQKEIEAAKKLLEEEGVIG